MSGALSTPSTPSPPCPFPRATLRHFVSQLETHRRRRDRSSVAKHSLFKTPVVSFFLKAMRAVPVAKAYDPGLPAERQASDAERHQLNAEMFSTVQARLMKDVSIVIFPEGTCHSTYEIKALKGGTARMALEAAKNDGPRFPIIPVRPF